MDDSSPGWQMLHTYLSDLKQDIRKTSRGIDEMHEKLSKLIQRISIVERELERGGKDLESLKFKELVKLREDFFKQIKDLKTFAQKNRHYLIIMSLFLILISVGVWGIDKVLGFVLKFL